MALMADNPNAAPVGIGGVSPTAFTSNVPACTALIEDTNYPDLAMDEVVLNQSLPGNTANIPLVAAP